MLGIGRLKRQKEDDDEEFHDEKDLKTRPKRKKRKEKEKKSWGKKERILIAVIIFLTVISSFILLILSKDWKLPKISIASPSTKEEPSILKKSDVKETLSDKAPSSAYQQSWPSSAYQQSWPSSAYQQSWPSSAYDEMKKSLNQRLLETKGTYGIDIVEIPSGRTFGINKNEKFEGASFFKLPLMIAAYIEEEKGNISLSSTHILQESDKQGGSGVLVSLPAGTSISLRDLISYMGKDSDNTAFNILGNEIGWKHVDEVIDKIGMLNTSFKDSITTPYDMGLLFQKFMNEELINQKSKDEVLESLVNSNHQSLIAKGVAPGIKVAHKQGIEAGVVNEASVIFSKNPYILIIMTKGQEEGEAETVIPDLSRIIYNSMSQQQ